MKVIVISMDTGKGKERRALLNYDYTWLEGCIGSIEQDPYVAEAKEKLYRRPNTLQRTYDGQAGCFASHIKALESIVKEGIGAVICEDDAVQTHALPEKMPTEICLLSGSLEHPKIWAKTAEWKKQKSFEIVEGFQDGVNAIDYDEFRWTITCAYWVPSPEKARELLDKLRDLKVWRAYDITLSKHRLINHLLFPAIYKHQDKVGSQIQQGRHPGVVINYRQQQKQ